MRPTSESEPGQRKGGGFGGVCAVQLSKWESWYQKKAILFFF